MGLSSTSQPRTVALLGNPNVGKSTLFNALTGLRQHTGNWPGKTVALAQGSLSYKAASYTLVDLPGTYSLQTHTKEETIAIDFLQNSDLSCTVAVCDATNLERSLLLILEAMEQTERLIVCVNLLDEAARVGLSLDLRRLEAELGVPVVGVCASRREGLEALMERVRSVCDGFACPRPKRPAAALPRERAIRTRIAWAEQLCQNCVSTSAQPHRAGQLDRLTTGPFTGPLLMALGLFGLLWLTICGANLCSARLESIFFLIQDRLLICWAELGWPDWLGSILLDGVFGTTVKVVAVMLPPVAIFFPLFTLLEDAGYLPRTAYLLDGAFCRAGCCGKQALTMCMGLGCNAVGVTGCRIIGSERERLLAMLTNSFIPCNGRFPLLIVLGSFLFAGRGGTLESALCLTLVILLSVWMTLLVSAVLSRTLLRGKSSSFVLELPPFRRPRLAPVLLRSLLDRTVFVLGRAVAVAAPAGALIWALANVPVGGLALLPRLATLLDPIGRWLGMNGAILLAFLLAWPANELVVPLLIMICQNVPTIWAAQGAATLSSLGWTERTALCTLLFCLFHWPCSTTVLTIRRETGRVGWTLLATALPTLLGVLLCRLVALV